VYSQPGFTQAPLAFLIVADFWVSYQLVMGR
jgi:hypothetical protein